MGTERATSAPTPNCCAAATSAPATSWTSSSEDVASDPGPRVPNRRSTRSHSSSSPPANIQAKRRLPTS